MKHKPQGSVLFQVHARINQLCEVYAARVAEELATLQLVRLSRDYNQDNADFGLRPWKNTCAIYVHASVTSELFTVSVGKVMSIGRDGLQEPCFNKGVLSEDDYIEIKRIEIFSPEPPRVLSAWAARELRK